MTDRSNLDWIKSRLTRRNLAEPAQVEEVKPEIRTGVDFPIRQRMLSDNEGNMAMGAIVIEWGYDVRDGADAEFRAWLRDNESKLSDALASTGVGYRGTYIVSVSTERGSGRYRTFWGLEQMGRIELLGSPDQVSSEFARLLGQFMSYRATASRAPSSTGIYQIAADPPAPRR